MYLEKIRKGNIVDENLKHAPLMMTVLQAQKYTGLSERFLRDCIREGRIVYVKSGNRTYINVDKLIEYLNTGELAPKMNKARGGGKNGK